MRQQMAASPSTHQQSLFGDLEGALGLVNPWNYLASAGWGMLDAVGAFKRGMETGETTPLEILQMASVAASGGAGAPKNSVGSGGGRLYAKRPVRSPSSPEPPYPGIWEDPKTIALRAEANTAPESPWLMKLFGTSRGELSDIAKSRRLDTPGVWQPKKGARGSASAEAVMTPQNAERLINQLNAFKRHAPNMTEGMMGWYITDPMYRDLVERFGIDEGTRMFQRANATGFMSPATDVATEINRGTGFNLLDQLGYHDQFVAGGLQKADKVTGAGPWRHLGYPDIRGHAYHSTAQAPNMSRFLRSPMALEDIIGSMGAASPDPKVPLYLQSSLMPHLGQQTRLPVPDAHFSRALGLADVRPWVSGPKGSGTMVPNSKHMKAPEYTPLGPWFYENVAREAGIEGVPAQATMWGGYGHATGVDTAVGAPKLELWADNIARRFEELNGRKPDPSKKSDVKEMRDLLYRVLKSDEHAALMPAQMVGLG